MTAEDPVNDVNRRFYEAFESLDFKRMEGIWLREDYIKCVHPGWALLSGWDAVMESWRRIFENTQQMRFTLTNVEARVRATWPGSRCTRTSTPRWKGRPTRRGAYHQHPMNNGRTAGS